MSILKGRRLTLEQRHTLAKEEEIFARTHDTERCETWYLVDTNWLQKWKAFVKHSDQLPGPIDNSRLVDVRTGVPKAGLQAKRDYRGVAKEIWCRWVDIYGGGPEVVRKELNLYASGLPPAGPASRYGSIGRARDNEEGYGSKVQASSAYVPRQPMLSSAQSQFPQSENSMAIRARRGKSMPPRQDMSAPTPSLPAQREAPKRPVCSKCDGPHESDACPHFKKPREQHRDAWAMVNRKDCASECEAVPIVRNADVIRQPGDGSCLFHSLSYGLADGTSASTLREEICSFMAKNAGREISGTPLNQWVQWDSGGNISSYVARMRRRGEWGGGIEMAALSQMRRVNVHVYERSRQGGFMRISAFTFPQARKTINVLYQGAMHYDALAIRG
eukprot:CAMPEP_0178445260 /NCGR_PEP_ID=MMETSP0689_2-20121128/40045_1 /TAXON_ID=160604 /ORGANISM="Amphidinium massartii, Strain CS-259" /LENGTH=387 /DNA_ID=CAMNT_0020069745 /DNA_START=13 /DNA_END=1176 /DNA_ORIENTATION=+